MPSCQGPGFLRYYDLRGFLELELHCFVFTAPRHRLASSIGVGGMSTLFYMMAPLTLFEEAP